MFTAIIGDIHGNLEALEATLRDARENGAGAFACLGDIVGYGANPNKCCETVRALGGPVVLGNHDFFASNHEPLGWFNPTAARAVQWTRLALSPDNKTWLRNLPFEAEIPGAQLVHAALDDPAAWHYLRSGKEVVTHFEKQTVKLCFAGHTHESAVFVHNKGTVVAADLKPFRIPEEDDVKVVVNPGAVGQPRDLNPVAAYVLFDPATMTIVPRRVPYDVKTAARKIVDAGLPRILARRLKTGT